MALLAILAIVPVATPAQADDLPDAYTQIVNHQVYIQPDGTSTFTEWGRYYVGTNGWEIRLNSDATWTTIKATAIAASGVGGEIAGGTTTVGGMILDLIPSRLQVAAATTVGLAGLYGDNLAKQVLLGNWCLGITVPTPSLSNAFARALLLIANNLPMALVGPFDDNIRVWFEQCGSPSTSRQDHIATLVPLPIVLPAAAVPQVSYTADRTILHGPDGSLYVMAGGAKFGFPSWNEFVNLGYSTAGMVNLDANTLATIPSVPRNGTVLRSGGGNIYAVAGGAKFVFGSWGEYTGQGYGSGSYINVPQSPLDQIGDAPGNIPQDGTIIQHPDGRLYIIVGRVKFQFGSMTEYHSLGYVDSQIIHVSGGPTDAIPAASTATPPSNGTVLRSGGGQIYVVAGGAKFHFGTLAEYTIQGYASGSWINVPQSPLDAIGDAPGNMPRNGADVLRPDGTLFVIAGGVRWQFGTMAEFSSEGNTTFTLVSQAAIDGIYDASSSHLPTNETVFEGTGTTIWVMKSGVRRSFTSMTQFANMGYITSQIVRVPDAVLNGLPSGGNLP